MCSAKVKNKDNCIILYFNSTCFLLCQSVAALVSVFVQTEDNIASELDIFITLLARREVCKPTRVTLPVASLHLPISAKLSTAVAD